MRVQLLFFEGCPHVDATRRVLRQALESAGLGEVALEQIDVDAASMPADFRDWGSPTILIDGVDIAGERGPSGRSCRLYGNAGQAGVPSKQLIEEQLRRAAGHSSASNLRGSAS
ncbi:MAG TPA: hypothetical protein VGK85_04635 [Myxococcaceae bacterium]